MSEDLRDDSADNSLDDGIAAAFGIDPTVDGPTTRSVLHQFRREGKAPRVALRPTEDEPTPITFRAREEIDGEAWSIGRYQIDGEIARGGVGAVFKARDVDLGREVALKVLRQAHQHNPELIRRFLEEAQIGGQLEHPGIVPIHEVGLLADERPYFAMKLVKGQTFAELLDSRTSPAEDRQRFLAIFEQVCQTLAYSHTRGVIHRDLKPSNVMVGAFGEVQVMDWGLAKVLAKGGVVDDARTTRIADSDAADDESAESAVQTMRTLRHGTTSIAGSVMGTPAYMPPEQAKGHVEGLDERSDVFGLGAMLCEVLTGRPPYVGKNLEEVFEKARKGDLSEARDRLASSAVGAELADLTLECLRFDKGERPRNALVVSKRVRAYLESTERRAQDLKVRASRMRQKLVISILLLIVVLVGGGAFLVVDRERSERERRSLAAVSEAMTRASELRAREAFARDSALWDAALAEIARAVRIAETDRQPELAADARDLRGQIEREVRDRRMVAELDRLREERENESEDLEFRFVDAFDSYGIDLLEGDLEAAAAKMRDSEIRNSLVLALDQWLVSNRFSRDGETRSRLRRIAQLADNDPWRQSLREAAHERDQEKLARLVEEARTKHLAPSTFEVLGFALRNRELAGGVWRRAQQLYPQDFWINLRLSDHLRYEQKPAQALQFARAAVALRPTSWYALYKLGSALAEANVTLEALVKFREAIVLSPPRRYPTPFNPYSKCARLLAESSSTIPSEELVTLVESVESRFASEGEIAGQPPHLDRELLLAEARFALGERRRAILALEALVRRDPRGGRSGRRARPGRSPSFGLSPGDSLSRMRQAVLPDLVSYASIDLAFDRAQASPTPEHLAVVSAFVEHHRASAEPAVRARVLYLEARELEARGDGRRAATKLAECLASAGSSDDEPIREPVLRLARALRNLGDGAGAERALRAGLEGRGQGDRDIWNLWAVISLVDLGRSPAQLLASFPDARAPGGFRAYGPELRWALETLVSEKPLRINCGGERQVDARGVTWEKDRLFTQPSFRPPWESRSLGDRDSAIRATSHRVLFGRGTRLPSYEVPLPPGRYRVRILAAERRGRRAHSEPRTIVLSVENKTASLAGDSGVLEVDVVDGLLQIGAEHAGLASIEIVPLDRAPAP